MTANIFFHKSEDNWIRAHHEAQQKVSLAWLQAFLYDVISLWPAAAVSPVFFAASCHKSRCWAQNLQSHILSEDYIQHLPDSYRVLKLLGDCVEVRVYLKPCTLKPTVVWAKSLGDEKQSVWAFTCSSTASTWRREGAAQKKIKGCCKHFHQGEGFSSDTGQFQRMSNDILMQPFIYS